MEDFITKFGDFGALGVVAGVLFFLMSRLQNKLIDIIEKNTKAFEELRAIIDRLVDCQENNKNNK